MSLAPLVQGRFLGMGNTTLAMLSIGEEFHFGRQDGQEPVIMVKIGTRSYCERDDKRRTFKTGKNVSVWTE